MTTDQCRSARPGGPFRRRTFLNIGSARRHDAPIIAADAESVGAGMTSAGLDRTRTCTRSTARAGPRYHLVMRSAASWRANSVTADFRFARPCLDPTWRKRITARAPLDPQSRAKRRRLFRPPMRRARASCDSFLHPGCHVGSNAVRSFARRLGFPAICPTLIQAMSIDRHRDDARCVCCRQGNSSTM